MGEWLKLLTSFWKMIFTEIFDKMILEINGISFSVGGFIVAALIIGLVISVFWKGAKT